MGNTLINTLIVDDSPLVRDILRDFLEAEGSFKIIGEAEDGEEGVKKILSLNPDLVTLDIEMPKMNGFQVIESVMKQTSVPIVVITSQDTAKTAYEATVRGALEFYPKDLFTASLSPQKRKEIYETLKRISGIKMRTGRTFVDAAQEPLNNKEQTANSAKMDGVLNPAAQKNNAALTETGCNQIEKRDIKAVVVASSTGGPKALSCFFSLFPADFPVPIAVVQHNSSGFDESFAQWLDTYTPLTVKIAGEGEVLKAGTIYIAQTDKHLTLDNLTAHYNDDEPENNQKPAADVLFRTAAESLGESVISVVLTGMGSDGADGTRKIHQMGGITLAQDEETSLIYGMPKAAAETGCIDMVLPLESIPPELIKLVVPEK